MPSAAAVTRATSAACVNNTGPPTGLPLSTFMRSNRDALSCHGRGSDGVVVVSGVEELLESTLVDFEDRQGKFEADGECAAWLKTCSFFVVV